MITLLADSGTCWKIEGCDPGGALGVIVVIASVIVVFMALRSVFRQYRASSRPEDDSSTEVLFSSRWTRAVLYIELAVVAVVVLTFVLALVAST